MAMSTSMPWSGYANACGRRNSGTSRPKRAIKLSTSLTLAVHRGRAGRRVLVVAHGNSLRALIKHLEGIGDDEIAELNVPTGIPRVYEFDKEMKLSKPPRYLGDAAAAEAKAKAVAAQADAKK